MKKQIILGLCIFNSLAGMDQNPVLTCHKYDTLRAPVFVHLLEKNNINTDGIVILNPECATGVLSAKLAEKADRVRGFDQNEDAISFARATYNRKNLSFEHHDPEVFTSERLFNLAVIDSCIDFITDKKTLFQRIHDCLPTDNGELFITITTNDNEPHPKITTAQEMVPKIQKIVAYLDEDQITDLTVPEYPSLQEVYAMLEETGFEIIKGELCSDYLPVTEQELKNIYRSIIMNLPIVEYIPKDSQENFITQYLKQYMAKLERNSDTKLLEPIITTTIHTRKIEII